MNDATSCHSNRESHQERGKHAPVPTRPHLFTHALIVLGETQDGERVQVRWKVDRSFGLRKASLFWKATVLRNRQPFDKVPRGRDKATERRQQGVVIVDICRIECN